MKNVVLFDFDGVIVDSFEMSYQVASEFHPGLTREAQKAFFEGNIYEEVERQTGKSITQDDDRAFFEKYIPQLMNLSPVAGISGTLENLKNFYALVVVSSTISSPIAEYLSKHNLVHYFDEIMGGELDRSKVKKIKMVLGKYATGPKQAVFVTDTLGDMREATKCGVRSIGVTWGFHERERLQKGNPAMIIETPQALPGAIQTVLQI